MYYVYILINKIKTKTYVGCTDNLDRRIFEHNSGKVRSSKPYLPYKLLYFEQYKDLKNARRRERFFKTTTGRKFLKRIIQELRIV